MPSQEVAPVVIEYDPDLQTEQVLEPSELPNCPAEHSVQNDVPVKSVYVPAEHIEQEEEPIKLL